MTMTTKTIEKATTYFRAMTIAFFVVIFIVVGMGFSSGVYLLIAADQNLENNADQKDRIRSMGAANIVLMTLLFALSVWVVYKTIRFESITNRLVHNLIAPDSMKPPVETPQQHRDRLSIPVSSTPPVTQPMTVPQTNTAPQSGFAFE
jgi:hypothetical protein